MKVFMEASFWQDMCTDKCDYCEISAKVIRMPETFSWGAKGVKCAGFSIRTALSLTLPLWHMGENVYSSLKLVTLLLM